MARGIAEPAAEVRDASKTFALGEEMIIALDHADLAVRSREFCCIYGASGSGKTTLLNVLAGIDVPDSGDVHVGGEVLSSLSEAGRANVRLRRIGVIFQSNNLLPEFTARENVALPLSIRGLHRHETDERTRLALKSVGVASLADRLPARMSGGQRQRVGIARALAGEPRLLVADEPTGALDGRNSLALFGLLKRLCAERDVAVVLATHDPLAKGFADSIYLMLDGTISAQ